jgi:hypothetical protein
VLPVVQEVDVIVCGAGPAGVAAAISAARAGANTFLIEVHGCLGGVWTAGQLAWVFDMEKPGLAREITQALDRRGARIGENQERYAYDIEAMKLLLEQLCAEAGVSVRLHTRVVAAARDPANRLRTVVTESKSGREAWRGKVFVDATGDGDLAAQAGCGFDLGHPDTGQVQPMTYMALVCVARAEAVKQYISFWAGSTYRQPAVEGLRHEIRRAGLETSYAKPTLFQVHGNLLALMINHEYGVSAMDADQATQATLRGRAEVNTVVDSLRALGGPWEGMHVVATCEQIGVREGRRIHGRYTVSTEDITQGVRHADGICRVTFNVDIHSLDPARDKGLSNMGVVMVPYDIPLRALIAQDVDGLLLAGRCISGDFYAHASYRVTGNSVATGEAAGVLAAISALEDVLPHEVPWARVERALHGG